MNKETIYRFLVVGLLASILVIQAIALSRIPPNPVAYGDLYGRESKAKGTEYRRQIMMQIPLTRIVGNVDVDVQNPVQIER